MPTIPVDIINIQGGANGRSGIFSGRIEGNLRAGIEVTAEVCHGIELGIGAAALANIGANAQALFIGGRVQGQLSAEAGAKIKARLEPNPFQSMGLTLEGGAFAYASAAGSLAIYLTPQYFARMIEDNLNDLTSDLFLIFLEEVEAEMGIYGKIAASAAIEGHLNILLKVEELDSGFEISGGFNYGWGVGSGYDFYCQAGFKNLRRAIKRSSLRINTEAIKEIRRLPDPNSAYLASVFDFTFPFVALVAYDIGNKCHEKKSLINSQDIALIIFNNFVENLQRFAIDALAESALKWFESELHKLYYSLTGIDISAADQVIIEQQIEELVELLSQTDLSLEKTSRILAVSTNIIDILNSHRLDAIKRPLATFWLCSILSLRAKNLLDEASASISAGSTVIGSVSAGVATELLPEPPLIVMNEMSETLEQEVIGVNVGLAVDYLVEIGITPLLQQHAKGFNELRERIENHFSVTEGDIIEDAIRMLSGSGNLSQLNSYNAIKQLIREEFIAGTIQSDILPSLKQQSLDQNLIHLAEYLDEVVEPSIIISEEFLFDKLDDFLIHDFSSLDSVAVATLTNHLSTGCGVVIYQILARNILFFDRVVSDFLMDNVYLGFGQLHQTLDDPNQLYFQQCRQVLEQNLPGHPNLGNHTEALRVLLRDITGACEEMFGPAIYTAQRRSQMTLLKRNILLSMAGDLHPSGGLNPETVINNILDCTHIPNQQSSWELANILMQIQGESYVVFQTRITPALSDFYLAITATQLEQTRVLLSQFIHQLQTFAQNAIDAWQNLSNEIRTDILELLETLEQQLTLLSASIQLHFNGNWGQVAKARIRTAAETQITANISDPTAQSAALTAFAVGEWLIINPMIDIAVSTLSAATTNIMQTLDGFVAHSSDAVQDFINWQKDLETQLLNDFQNMVILSASDAATDLLDTLFPPNIIIKIEDYLQAREEQKQLEQTNAEKSIALQQLEIEKQQHTRRFNQHRHQANLQLSILSPDQNREHLYPSSLSLSVAMKNGKQAFLENTGSRRIQIMLNGAPLDTDISHWSFNADENQFEWHWQSANGEKYSHGLNFLEVSWISGETDSQVYRDSVPFLVDANVWYETDEMAIAFDANPPGSDVDTEHVTLNWQGNKKLHMGNWIIKDLADHVYILPENLALEPGDTLRIYTGGTASNNLFPADNRNHCLYMGRGAAIWNNEGDTLTLIDSSGITVKQVTYANTNN